MPSDNNPFAPEKLCEVLVGLLSKDSLELLTNTSQALTLDDFVQKTLIFHEQVAVHYLRHIIIVLQEQGVDLSPVQELLELSGINNVSG